MHSHSHLFTFLGFVFIIAIFAFIGVPWYKRYQANKSVKKS